MQTLAAGLMRLSLQMCMGALDSLALSYRRPLFFSLQTRMWSSIRALSHGFAHALPHVSDVPRQYLTALATVSVRCFSRFTPEEEAKFREIENWAGNFKKNDIPVDSFEKNFNRSSGPGGQNVNKVNTKAELRFPINSAHWIMPEVRDKLKKLFPRYINSQNEFMVTSEVYRTQKQNIEDCVNKIYECIREAAKVPAATTVEQKKKVEGLQRAFNERRLETKKLLKGKKQDRKGGNSKYD